MSRSNSKSRPNQYSAPGTWKWSIYTLTVVSDDLPDGHAGYNEYIRRSWLIKNINRIRHSRRWRPTFRFHRAIGWSSIGKPLPETFEGELPGFEWIKCEDCVGEEVICGPEIDLYLPGRSQRVFEVKFRSSSLGQHPYLPGLKINVVTKELDGNAFAQGISTSGAGLKPGIIVRRNSEGQGRNVKLKKAKFSMSLENGEKIEKDERLARYLR